MRNKVREKMLVFFVLENPLKSLHKDFVYRTLKENFELDDKTLGYDFRPESFFPTSWGGGVDCTGTFRPCLSSKTTADGLKMTYFVDFTLFRGGFSLIYIQNG